MSKIHTLVSAALLSLICGSTHAQFTQMIVDNNNRIMPIFFHDSPHQQKETVVQLPAPELPTTKPLLVSNHQRQATQYRTLPRNPLTGPYFLSPQRHRIMAAAHSLLGTPYIYGGNNPERGLDCSSLMQHIHKKALGVAIPRTAAQQRDSSKTIDFQNLQPGDMLFFKIDRRNNHVGIYIGEGKFILASASNRRATIASMNLPYWKKRFIKFGSYLGS